MGRKVWKALCLLLAVLLIAGSFAACTKAQEPAEPAETQEPAAEETQGSDQIADASEQIAHEDVVDDSWVPVPASALQDGTYEISVDSSSSMFNIVACTLTVAGEEMTADMTMGGTGYRYIYLGTPEEAVAAAESDYLLPEVDANGAHHYIVPVEALDAGVDCAAFSDSKEKWYDRVLVFRSSSLPMEAYDPGFLTTVSSLGLADGSYTCEVSLAGGSGKASVQSPANVTIRGGEMTAEIIWSSDKYDFMVVNGTQYNPITTEGGSTFLIPIRAFNFNVPVQADTIAMSTPHMIDYTLYFDASTIQ